ncbi:MAG: hypothetical protein Q9191_002759 [Dirinaria sp. TL-2023a]
MMIHATTLNASACICIDSPLTSSYPKSKLRMTPKVAFSLAPFSKSREATSGWSAARSATRRSMRLLEIVLGTVTPQLEQNEGIQIHAAVAVMDKVGKERWDHGVHDHAVAEIEKDLEAYSSAYAGAGVQYSHAAGSRGHEREAVQVKCTIVALLW